MRLMRDVYMVGSGAIGLSDAMDGHVYMLDGGNQMALIDAGVGRDVDRIIQNVREDGLDERAITYLLLTHAHADHAGGARALAERTGARIVCSAIEGRLLMEGTDEELGLVRARQAGIYTPDYVYAHVAPDIIIASGQEMRVGRYIVRTIEVPGHSEGSICYLANDGGPRMLFCGDVVFCGGTIGIGNWAGSSLEDYRASIDRVSGLQVAALFPGHYLWTIRDGQSHLDQAVENMSQAWVPPAWQHMHPHH
jgi:glyoxylase-like metal-dependent hydrolase (beta-lactamase superfamily II)